jgi:hypothetical protein
VVTSVLLLVTYKVESVIVAGRLVKTISTSTTGGPDHQVESSIVGKASTARL